MHSIFNEVLLTLKTLKTDVQRKNIVNNVDVSGLRTP